MLFHCWLLLLYTLFLKKMIWILICNFIGSFNYICLIIIHFLIKYYLWVRINFGLFDDVGINLCLCGICISIFIFIFHLIWFVNGCIVKNLKKLRNKLRSEITLWGISGNFRCNRNELQYSHAFYISSEFFFSITRFN